MSRELKVSDLAKRHGVNRKTAYRWLVEIERKYGASVVGRRGKRGDLFTTEDAFAQVAPLVASRSAEDKRLRDMEERIDDVEKRTDKQSEAIADLRREFQALASRWFARKM